MVRHCAQRQNQGGRARAAAVAPQAVRGLRPPSGRGCEVAPLLSCALRVRPWRGRLYGPRLRKTHRRRASIVRRQLTIEVRAKRAVILGAMLAFLALPTYANDNAYSARLIRNRVTGEPGTIRASGPWERENHRLRLRPDRSLAGCQPAKRAGNPPQQRADTLSKASTWRLLAATVAILAWQGAQGRFDLCRQCLLRANLDRLSVIRDGPINLARSLERFAAAVVSCGMPRVDLDRVGVIRDRVVDFPLRAVSEAAIVVGVGILRGDLDCFGEICDRAIVVALGLAGAAPVEVGVGIPRIDLDRLAIVCDGVVDFAPSLVGGATVIVSCGTPGVDFDRLAVVRDRAVDFANSPVGDAAIVVNIGIAAG